MFVVICYGSDRKLVRQLLMTRMGLPLKQILNNVGVASEQAPEES